MTTVHSATAGRRRLRAALRQAREAIHLTQEQVAAEMDWSPSKVIRIETGGVGVSTSDLRQLLQLYQVDDPARVNELVALARLSRQRPWWARYKDSVPTPYLSFIGLEHESSALRCVAPAGMPGLLQTREFAEALLQASWWAVAGDRTSTLPPAPSDISERVDMRLKRQQELLERADPPEVTAILDEAVLWRRIGGTGVLERQLRHLVGLGRRDNIAIQVLPFAAGMINMVSPFVLLEFADPTDADVVYAESAFEIRLLDTPDAVGGYRTVFELMQRASLPEAESLTMISRIADSLAG